MGYPKSFNELEKWRDEQRLASSPKKLIRALENKAKHEADPVRLRILNRFLAEEHIAQGRPGAAAAIRAEDPVWQVHLWHEALRYEDEEKDLLPILQERLRTETHPMKASALRGFMIDEYHNREDYAAATAVYLDDYNADPSEPMPLISLAGQKLHIEDQPGEAIRFASQAVDVALRAGVWRRLALGAKARTALRLRDYPVVEDMIKQIMQLTFTRGNADVGVERDFLDRLPPGSIDPAVARQYDEYCRARRRPPHAGWGEPPAFELDEPPAFELPEWEQPDGQNESEPATAEYDSEIDALILSFAKAKRLKVGRIVADVSTECERRGLKVSQHAIGNRVGVLVDQGKLRAFGNVSYWGFSEVKLPD